MPMFLGRVRIVISDKDVARIDDTPDAYVFWARENRRVFTRPKIFLILRKQSDKNLNII